MQEAVVGPQGVAALWQTEKGGQLEVPTGVVSGSLLTARHRVRETLAVRSQPHRISAH